MKLNHVKVMMSGGTKTAADEGVPFTRIGFDDDKSIRSNRSGLTKSDSSAAAINRVGWVGHLLILSFPLIAMSCTLALLLILLHYDKQQNDAYRNENEKNNNYNYENVKNNGHPYKNEITNYYHSILEKTISIIMSEYEPYWQLLVLSSLATFFTSVVTIGRNIQIFVSQNRQMLENSAANNNNNNSTSMKKPSNAKAKGSVSKDRAANRQALAILEEEGCNTDLVPQCCTKSCTNKFINALATIINIASYIGLVILVLYKADDDDSSRGHTIGAALFFWGTAVYAVLHCYLLWTQPNYHILLKLFFTLLTTVIMTSTLVFMYTRLDNVFGDDYGTAGLEMTVCEWIAVITTAVNIGFHSLLFYVDPVDDEIRDFLVFFCCIDRCCTRR
mmetsp:Transcript_33150/g.38216  ORF Transcript_33150/g.38216 Transcript_33150/m.38216 type:complete len:389 (+) Transcript_33150:122-1288(+)